MLAGGRSRRFGSLDKARLPVGGRPLLRRSLDALTPITTSRLVVGGPPRDDVEVIADVEPAGGPIGGLLAAWRVITTSHALVLACDLPFVTDALLQELCAVGATVPLALVDTPRSVTPLCLSVRRDALPALTTYWDAGGRRIGDLQRVVTPCAKVSVAICRRLDPTGHLLLNVNDPLTYARAIAVAEHGCAASYFTDLDESKPNP